MATSVPTGGPGRNNDGDFADDFAIPRSGGIKDAVWRIARSYPGGLRPFAARMEMAYDTFQKKASPNCDTHHFQPEELVDIQVFAGRCDALYAMATDLQHVCLPMPDHSTDQVALTLARVGAEVGDLFREAQAALQDGTITPSERKRISHAAADVMAAMAAFLRVI